MKMNRRDVFNLEGYVADLAEQYEIKIAADMEEFSRQLHETVEDALFYYADDMKREAGFADLGNYEAQY